MTGSRRMGRATAVAIATTGMGLWLAASGVLVEAADPVYMPLTYKPRTSARPAAAGGQWSTMSVGADGKQK
eukprot:evm.model.NODE_19065_length_7578_cov_30.316574.4